MCISHNPNLLFIHLLSCPGKNQESWALDLEVEDLKLLCPDGTDAGLEEYEQCHIAAVPANAVVVRMEDKCRVWKYLERLQVGVDISCMCFAFVCVRVCVCMHVFPQSCVWISGACAIYLHILVRRYLLNCHPSSVLSVWETPG